MLKRLIVVFAAVLFVMAFGSAAAHAVVEDINSPCPNCGQAYAFDYTEKDANGDPITFFECIDEKTCCEKYNVSCTSCAWVEEVIVGTYPHEFAWVKDGNKMAYQCEHCKFVSKTDKLANPLKVKGKTVKVKYSKLKKKSLSLKRSKVITFSKKGKGTVTYTKVSGNKKITISKKTGKVKIKKGLKKGTYKVKVKVKAAGDSIYKNAVKKVTIKIKVK